MDVSAAHPQLPEPALTLSLPSIHDGTLLDCRVYLPPSMVGSSSAARPVWRGDAAVVAHPYAPLGGSYNDPTVRLLAHTLLTRGQFVVATFNFRGAGNGGVGSPSAGHLSGKKERRWGGSGGGRTSWTAKPETADYMTVVGFLYYFVHVLDPYGHKAAATETETETEIETSGPEPHAEHRAPAFLCAGYSYGAMVTSLLPPLHAILAHFVRPRRGSPAAAVRWRAARWAAIQNADLREMREAAAHAAAAKGPLHGGSSLRGETRLSMGVRVGGGETPRRSHDGGGGGGGARKSLDAVFRRSVEHYHHHQQHASTATGSHAHRPHHHHRISGLVARVVAGHTRHCSGGSLDDSDDDDGGAGGTGAHRKTNNGDEKDKNSDLMPAVPGLPAVRPAYLLVSPPVGLATRLATLSWGSSSSGNGNGDTPESKLTANPTLVVYGDQDGFVSHRTMRQWTARLTGASLLHRHRSSSNASGAAVLGTGSGGPGQGRGLFRALVVHSAGHFWVEGQTLYELEAAVEGFVAEVVYDGEYRAPEKRTTEPTTAERRPAVRPVSSTG